MTCSDIQAGLLAYQLGGLEALEREAVETHLPGCRACVERLVSLKRTVDLAARLDQRPSVEVRARVRTELAARLRPARPSPSRPAVFGFLAAAVLGALVAAWWARDARPVVPPAPAGSAAPLLDADSPYLTQKFL